MTSIKRPYVKWKKSRKSVWTRWHTPDEEKEGRTYCNLRIPMNPLLKRVERMPPPNGRYCISCDRLHQRRYENSLKIPCPECGKFAVYIPTSNHLYSKDFGPVYECSCGARVGVHKGTTTPLGTPAGDILREWRKSVHTLFDPIWRKGEMKRNEAYKWLSEEMNLSSEECHIGLFDKDMCMDAIKIITLRRTEDRK